MALRNRERPVRLRRLPRPGTVVLAVFAVTAQTVAWRATGGPGFVDQVIFENPGPYDVEVAVAGEGGRRWLGLGAVPSGGERRFGSVIDHGDLWAFRFTYAGVHGGDTETTRAGLAADGWRFRVPPEVELRLAGAGLEASPR